jgi:hypothetical protein
MTAGPGELSEAGTRVLAMLETGDAQPVRMLLDSARRAVRESEWDSALYRCRAAIEQALRSGDTAAHASALVCAGCVELAMGDAGQAAESYFRAAQLFHLLDQTANEAAAALGFGLACSVRRQGRGARRLSARAHLLRALVASQNRAGNTARAEPYAGAREARDLMDRVLINPVIEPASSAGPRWSSLRCWRRAATPPAASSDWARACSR